MPSDLHSLNSTEAVLFALLTRTGAASYSRRFHQPGGCAERRLMLDDMDSHGSSGVDGKTVSGGFDGGVFVVDDWQSKWVVIYVLPFGFCS